MPSLPYLADCSWPSPYRKERVWLLLHVPSRPRISFLDKQSTPVHSTRTVCTRIPDLEYILAHATRTKKKQKKKTDPQAARPPPLPGCNALPVVLRVNPRPKQSINHHHQARVPPKLRPPRRMLSNHKGRRRSRLGASTCPRPVIKHPSLPSPPRAAAAAARACVCACPEPRGADEGHYIRILVEGKPSPYHNNLGLT